MTGGRARAPFPLARVVLYALIGGAIALLLGLLAVAVAPDNGFADLAFASLTKIFFVPLGLVIGGVIGWRTAGASPDRRRDSSPKGRNGGSGGRSRP